MFAASVNYGKIIFEYGSNTSNRPSFNSSNIIDVIIDHNNLTLKQNDSITFNTTISTQTFNCPVNLFLFAENRGAQGVNEKISMKLYDCKITNDNNSIVGNFIPVYDTVTQKYGMYDKVSQTFKGNLGTGNFTGGND